MIENNLSEEDIINLYNNDWDVISYHKYLTEEFIREHQDKINWINISWSQKLSENFIREFQNKIYWGDISCNPNLSENSILEFENNVFWDCISEYQKLSLKFIKDNIEKLDVVFLLKNKNISEEIKQYIKMYLAIF